MSGAGPWRSRLETLVTALATLPLSVAVAHVGLQCGVDPWVIMLSSMSVFSAALQLMIYEIAAAGGAGPLPWVAAALLPLRLLVYSVALGRHMSSWPLLRRLAALYFLTDISYLEFQRELRAGPKAALARYTCTSRALWLSWQLGTLAGLLLDRHGGLLPKEGVAVLVFGCLALGQLRGPRANSSRMLTSIRRS